MFHRSPLPDIALPETTLFALLDDDSPALTEIDTGRSVTYAELRALALGTASALAARGVGPGSVVELRMPNSINFAAGLLGASATGATVCLIGHSLRDDEARHLATLAGATDRVRADDIRPGTFTPVGDPDDVAVIPFSSGTTGLPKAVELTHRAVTANAAQFNAALAASGIGPGGEVVAPLPFSHIYGLNTLLLSSLAAGRHVYTAARFDFAEFAAAHRGRAIDISYIAPPIALALANHADPADFAGTRFMVCGAASLDTSLARTVERRIGVEILQGYGTTESAPVTHVGIAGKSDPGTIGFALPNTQFRLSDSGELLVRGPQLMRGYLGNPDATAAAIRDGWLHTGDIARINSDETVTIVDRAKEVFKYHGFQVAPAELEALLITHPRIADAAVTAHTRTVGGVAEEVPRAFVVKQGALDAEEVMAWVAARVTPYKKVRVVTFVDAIPRSAAGKILRRELTSPGAE
ncbi:AMP-binding protein [Corynebacterium lujinxingii]|uniref:AMP-binding protein n=1 Tax=Corynebacterium lujinxingii TaxID=2763010 RepID=A0A7H0JXP2_9CORY|nr:AMP-binding protein [Corynebacterium lujinxingii]MBC3177745.1 AMP-binding protein [Corynebacterium lujinxingii]NNO10010.1 AMP-binding protein [Corynebacterium lujinxingii]QNP89808.1 AMP-binding protein [Corynebacterium lujinxingii]